MPGRFAKADGRGSRRSPRRSESPFAGGPTLAEQSPQFARPAHAGPEGIAVRSPLPFTLTPEIRVFDKEASRMVSGPPDVLPGMAG